MEILHQTCCIQDYNPGFQVRKIGLLVWEKYSVRDEQLHLEREAVCRLSHDKFRESSDLQRETQRFILGIFFFFKVFLQAIHKQDHSRSTIGALICNSNSMWTTLTSSGDAVTFDSHSKTPKQLLLEACLPSIQDKKTAFVLKCKLFTVVLMILIIQTIWIWKFSSVRNMSATYCMIWFQNDNANATQYLGLLVYFNKNWCPGKWPMNWQTAF